MQGCGPRGSGLSTGFEPRHTPIELLDVCLELGANIIYSLAERDVAFGDQSNLTFKTLGNHVEVLAGPFPFLADGFPKFNFRRQGRDGLRDGLPKFNFRRQGRDGLRDGLPKFNLRRQGRDGVVQLRLRGERWQNLLNAPETLVDISDNLFEWLRVHSC